MGTRVDALPRRKPTPPARRKAAGKKNRSGHAGWNLLWPILAGIAVTPFAMHYAEILPLLGTTGLLRLRLLYPFAMLVHQPQLGLGDRIADALAQGLLYLQFPAYGLILALLWRSLGVLRSLLTLALLHLCAFGAVWLLAQM